MPKVTIDFNKRDKWTIFWAWVGKIGIIIPIVLGLIELGKFLFVKEFDVKTVASFKFYEIPDSLFADFGAYIKKIDSIETNENDTLQQNVKLKYQTESFLTDLLNKMNRSDYNIPTNVGENISDIYSLLYPQSDTTRNDFFNFQIKPEKLRESVNRLKSNIFYSTYICKLSISNNSSKEINNVVLKINSIKGYFKIRETEEIKGSEGYSEQISDFLEVIEIGKLDPQEIKEIIVWIPKPVKREQFKLTHSGNMIDIDFEEFEAF